MFVIGPRDVSRLLVAGGPSEWLTGVRWPLHRTLLELSQATAAGASSLPYSAISTRPDPEVAVAVLGADAAVVALAWTPTLGFGINTTRVLALTRTPA